MIEGQEGVTWDQWRALAATAEASGYDALLRSDHYLSVDDEGERGALDAWATLAALAATTKTLRLGTLVSPATFRHPAVLAKNALTVDHVSGGRLELGIGTGWHHAEHAAFGFPFPPMRERFDLYAEQVEIVHGLLRPGRFTFTGRHYRLDGVESLPRPVQEPHPPLVLGGSAKPRAAALAARFADEYNVVYADLDTCRERRARIAQACERAGREPIAFSLMTAFAIDGDHARRMGEIRPGWIAGTIEQCAEQLRALEEAGVERVMLQHLLHDDLETVERVGRELIPLVS